MSDPRPKRPKNIDDIKVPAALGGSGAEDRSPSVSASEVPVAGSALQPNLLIVLDQRDFVRGCLICWLNKFCSEFTTLAVTDVEQPLEESATQLAAAALIGVGSLENTDGWLARQMGLLRDSCPDLPILLIIDADDRRIAEALAVRLGAHGYISVRSMSTKVAAAVLRLVVAGERYFPTTGDRDWPQLPMDNVRKRPTAGGDMLESLTPREEVVLTILGCGAQNKDIANQLGMSVSTVKAHVHHIIRKLNVRNRTEVVLAARAMQSAEAAQFKSEESIRIRQPRSIMPDTLR